jgi:hypothetical protein
MSEQRAELLADLGRLMGAIHAPAAPAVAVQRIRVLAARVLMDDNPRIDLMAIAATALCAVELIDARAPASPLLTRAAGVAR